MKKFQQYFVPILIAAIVVSGLSGYGIGRATAGSKASDTAIIGGADGETEIVIADGSEAASTESAEVVTESVDDGAAAATEATTEAASDDANSNGEVDDEDDLVDAADSTNPEDISSGSDNSGYDVDVSAYKDTGSMDDATVDPAYVKNVTLREADLPDGVASTLWGKNNKGKAAMQVVILGDSQFGNFVDTNGMAYKLSQKCQANVYNLAIGGTAASISAADVDDNGRFDDTGLCGWVKAITGDIDPEKVFAGYTYQLNVFNSCDFSKTDIFIIEYGVNDYFMKSPILQSTDKSENRQDNLGDNIRTYNGALEYACMALRSKFPNCQIILCAPTYAEFFESGTGNLLGNYYSVSNGVGTLAQYVEAMKNVPGNFQNTQCFVPEQDMDVKMDYYNADEYLLDGVHLTEPARELYTQILGRLMIRAMGYEIPEDTDPLDYDWRSTK